MLNLAIKPKECKKMQVLLDNISKKKILAVKSKERIFSVEFPADSDTAELYDVIAEIKEKLWEALETEKKAAEEKEPEIKIEEPEVTEEEKIEAIQAQITED